MKNATRASILKAVAILLYAAVVLPFLRSGVPGSYDRYLVYNYIILFFVPLLLITAVFRDQPEEYAVGPGDWRAALRFFVLLYVPTLIGLAIAARWPAFQAYYPINKMAGYGRQEFLFWEVAYNGFYMFSWEFFFRGFLLFGLRPALGKGSLHFQAIVFGVMHWGKPMPEFFASFLTGYVLGIVALRTRTFLPTFALHAACAASFDFLVLAWGGRLSLLLGL